MLSGWTPILFSIRSNSVRWPPVEQISTALPPAPGISVDILWLLDEGANHFADRRRGRFRVVRATFFPPTRQATDDNQRHSPEAAKLHRGVTTLHDPFTLGRQTRLIPSEMPRVSATAPRSEAPDSTESRTCPNQVHQTLCRPAGCPGEGSSPSPRRGWAALSSPEPRRAAATPGPTPTAARGVLPQGQPDDRERARSTTTSACGSTGTSRASSFRRRSSRTRACRFRSCGSTTAREAITTRSRSGFKNHSQAVVDRGLIAICQTAGGSLYSHPTAVALQVAGWQYMSSVFTVSSNVLRSTSGGGALAVETYARDLMPRIAGMYNVNATYDIRAHYDQGGDSRQVHRRGVRRRSRRHRRGQPGTAPGVGVERQEAARRACRSRTRPTGSCRPSSTASSCAAWRCRSPLRPRCRRTRTGTARPGLRCPTSSPRCSAGVSSTRRRPTVSIVSPANGATVKGTVTVSITATDNVAVTDVGLYLGTRRIATAKPATGSQWADHLQHQIDLEPERDLQRHRAGDGYLRQRRYQRADLGADHELAAAAPSRASAPHRTREVPLDDGRLRQRGVDARRRHAGGRWRRRRAAFPRRRRRMPRSTSRRASCSSAIA